MIGRILSLIACGALDEMDGIALFDLVGGQSVSILEHTTGIDQPLPIWRCIGIFWGRQLGFQIEDGSREWKGEDIFGVTGRLDVEGDGSLIGDDFV